MASHVPPETVAEAFVKQYYVILHQSPADAHKFYQESSVLGWQGDDGLLTRATTLNGINEKIMSSDFKNGSVKTLTVDAQQSLSGGVFVAVCGLWTNIDNITRKFSQSFFLAQQERGFFVLNDILRFSDSSELTITSVVNDDKLNETATSVPNAALSIEADNHASNTRKAMKNENINGTVDSSIPKNVDATVTKHSSPPREKVFPVIQTSWAKGEAPKITYASVVAKLSPPTSPKSVQASSNVDNQVIASLTTKSVSRIDVGRKASIPPTNVGRRTSTANNGEFNANPTAKSIYIGGLPHDITKQGVADVMRIFGPLRRSSDGVQLKKHDDGFCCGFVEFESADAARRAVEVRYVQFGNKEAYCTYKRNPDRGNDGRGRSPPKGVSRNNNFRGKENGEVGNGHRSQSGSRSGQSRGVRQN